MQIALYQPDIPQNVGAFLRLSACMSIPLHVIEPCGFPWDEKKIRRAGMDYIDQSQLIRHTSWEAFLTWCGQQALRPRLGLLTTKTKHPYYQFAYTAQDILLLGKESAGVPDSIHEMVDYSVTIPMASHARSLNVVISAAIVLGEALRQTDLFP